MNAAFLSLLGAALAGAASTLLELAWWRAAVGALPGALPAGALVVPVFLAAWAVGSAAAGRLADGRRHPLSVASRLFGAGALLVLLAPRALALLAGDLPPLDLLGRTLAGGLPVMPAAMCLGGAVPLLSKLRRDAGLSAARATGGVAAAMAVGGAAGCVAFVPALETDGGPTAAAAMALALAGLCCFLLTGSVRVGQPAPSPVADDSPRVPLMFAVLIAGALLVAGQLAMLRVDSQWQGDSVATIAEILGGLHLGMALGALSFAALPRGLRASHGAILSLILGGMALMVPAWAAGMLGRLSPWTAAALLAAPLGFSTGSSVTAACRRRAPATFGAWIGDLSAASTAGGLLGGLIFAHLLVPRLGTGAALQGMALVAVAGAMLLSLLDRAWVLGVLAALALAGCWLSPPLELPWRTDALETRLVAQREGPHGVVSLVQLADGGARLKIDNRFGLGGSEGARLQARLGRIGAALAPSARRVLLLGLGMGHTLAGLSSTTSGRVECVEINAQILELGLPIPFEPGRPPLGGAPTLSHADARAHLLLHRGEYDLIVGDLFFPWVTGAGGLHGREQFLAMRRALSDGGVAVQWLPLHQLPWPAFGTVANAFLSAFPSARLIVGQSLASQPLVALVGGLEGGLPPQDEMDALLQRSACQGGPNGAADVFDLFIADAWALGQRFQDEPTCTQDHPWSELGSLRRDRDEAFIARTNLRLLADMVEPLSTAALSQRPPSEKEERLLGVELTARAAALQALLGARAAQLTLADESARERLPFEIDALSRELDGWLISGWRAFPGHRELRVALLERAQLLVHERRFEAASALLETAQGVLADPGLAGAWGGILLRLGRVEEALAVLDAAREQAPRDRTVLVNLGSALALSARDEQALAVLKEARAAFGGQGMPAVVAAVIELIEKQPGSAARARELLLQIEPGDPWSDCLRRLIGEA